MGYDFELDGRASRVTPAGAGASPPLAIDAARNTAVLEIDGVRSHATLEPGTRTGEYFLVVDGRRERLFVATRHDVHFVHWRGRSHRIEAWNALDRARQAALRAGGVEEIRAPMPGVVVGIAAVVGAEVEPGAALLTIESMKLQTAITAPHAARIAEICVAVGDHFDQGAILLRLESAATAEGTAAGTAEAEAGGAGTPAKTARTAAAKKRKSKP